MRRTALRRKTALRRTRIDRRNRRNWSPPRVDPAEALAVFERDGGCIARRYDYSHVCFGRLTLAHVPKRGENAYGKKAPSTRQFMVAECLGANSGGLQPWSETHHDIERFHLARYYPEIHGEEA